VVGSNFLSDVEQMLSHVAKKGMWRKAVKISWINCLQILVEIASNAATGCLQSKYTPATFLLRIHLPTSFPALLNSAVIVEAFLGRSVMANGALGMTQFANGRSKIHYDGVKINNTVSRTYHPSIPRRA